MRHPSENNFNLFSSLLLGGLGVGLLLIPNLLNIVPQAPVQVVMGLGVICFAAALYLQISLVLPFSNLQIYVGQGMAGALLLLVSGLYARNGFWMEAISLFFVSITQISFIFISTSKRLAEFEILNFL